MSSALLLSIIILKLEYEKRERIRKRHLRDRSNPIDIPEPCFIAIYRLNKRSFKMVLEETSSHMQKSSIPNILRLASICRFLAVESFQGVVSNDLNLSMDRTTFCRVLWDVVNVIEEVLCPQWIQSEMCDVEIRDSKQHFYNKFKIPGVIGCLDGTHIRIIKPTSNSELYYCRKGYFSLNVMIICDYKMRIRAVDASKPGSCHDAFIWNLSDANKHYAEVYASSNRNCWLLADSAYALEPFVMVPYRSPAVNSMQHKFNLAPTSARNKVERTIANLKSRFRCLQMCLSYNPQKVVKITNVCCALHNICKKYNGPFEEEGIFISNDELQEGEEVESNNEAMVIRDNIARSLR